MRGVVNHRSSEDREINRGQQHHELDGDQRNARKLHGILLDGARLHAIPIDIAQIRKFAQPNLVAGGRVQSDEGAS